jgi:hypothetical protein
MEAVLPVGLQKDDALQRRQWLGTAGIIDQKVHLAGKLRQAKCTGVCHGPGH